MCVLSTIYILLRASLVCYYHNHTRVRSRTLVVRVELSTSKYDHHTAKIQYTKVLPPIDVHAVDAHSSSVALEPEPTIICVIRALSE